MRFESLLLKSFSHPGFYFFTLFIRNTIMNEQELANCIQTKGWDYALQNNINR